jgi:transcriptional regulator with XRE-family HTH domain
MRDASTKRGDPEPRRVSKGAFKITKAISKSGAALKVIRLQRRWTLADVSERTGLPVSTLSKIENGKMSLSYDKLARISKGMDIDIAALFAGETATASKMELVTGRRSVVRAGEGEPIDTDVYSHLYLASDLLNKRFVPLIAEIKARSVDEFSEMIRHPGEEYTYVLEGTVELHTDVYAPLRLEAGDSIFFDSGMGHVYIAATYAVCRVLTICSGEESQLRASFGTPDAPSEASEPPRVVKGHRRSA